MHSSSMMTHAIHRIVNIYYAASMLCTEHCRFDLFERHNITEKQCPAFKQKDVMDDYMHQQIIKIAINFKKQTGSKDLKELVSFYRDLLDVLHIPDNVPASFIDWIQDYIDLAREVSFRL